MPTPSPISRIAQYFPIVEVIALAGTALGVYLKYKGQSGASEVLIISLSTLAVIYYFTAFIPPRLTEQEQKEEQGEPNAATPGNARGSNSFFMLLVGTIAPKILGISMSVCCVGILFFLNQFKGYGEMLMIGTLSITVGSVIGLIGLSVDETVRRRLGSILPRAISLAVVSGYILYTYGLPVVK